MFDSLCWGYNMPQVFVSKSLAGIVPDLSVNFIKYERFEIIIQDIFYYCYFFDGFNWAIPAYPIILKEAKSTLLLHIGH